MVYCEFPVVRNRRLWQDLARTGHGLPSAASANRQTRFYAKCVKVKNCAAGTGKSAGHKSDLLRVARRLFCVGILSATAQVSQSPTFFQSSRNAFDFVCLARLTTDK
jgi:hypothetical protein